MADPSNPMQQPSDPQNQSGAAQGAPASAAGSGSTSISMADLVAGLGGAVTFIFSFLDFWKFGPVGRNAWSTDAGAFVSTIPAILGLALAVVIGLGLGHVKLPDHVLTFTWDQVKATWGIAAAGIMIAFIAAGGDGVDQGIGFWFMLIGSLAMAAGTIMKLLGAGASTVKLGGGTGSSGAPQFGSPQPGQGATPPPPPGGGQPGSAPPPPPPGY